MSNGADIGVFGFGVTGQSVARFLLRQGVSPKVYDTRDARELAPEFAALDVCWNATPEEMGTCATAYVSPGLSMQSCGLRHALAQGVRLRSDVDLFFDHVHTPVIGITGTNGKSTVTMMAEHILTTADITAVAGGNLGLPALDLIDDAVDCYVLELSSFQLQRSAQLPLASATILNVTADHIDMHGDFQDYVASKQHIYLDAQRCIWNRDDELTRPATVSPDDLSFGLSQPDTDCDYGIVERGGEQLLVRGDTPLLKVEELPLDGPHNALNALAACALIDAAGWRSSAAGLRSFNGLSHRYEWVATIDGVSYIDDSKATNVGATCAALEGLPRDATTLLIAGGDAKGADLAPLAERLQQRVRLVVTLGVDAAAVEQQAARAGIPSVRCDSMDLAVGYAANAANAGDTVLLSPACASLDMYDNYMQRGMAFCAAVETLESAP